MKKEWTTNIKSKKKEDFTTGSGPRKRGEQLKIESKKKEDFTIGTPIYGMNGIYKIRFYLTF